MIQETVSTHICAEGLQESTKLSNEDVFGVARVVHGHHVLHRDNTIIAFVALGVVQAFLEDLGTKDVWTSQGDVVISWREARLGGPVNQEQLKSTDYGISLEQAIEHACQDGTVVHTGNHEHMHVIL